MNTIDDVYKKYPTNTLIKFEKIAKQHEFTKQQSKEYLDNDWLRIKPYHHQLMRIYTKAPENIPIVRFFNLKAISEFNYLIFINKKYMEGLFESNECKRNNYLF